MNGDLSGRAFKNVSGSSLQITDVGVFEIRPDGLVSTADYPILETSIQFRKLVSLSYLLEDPSRRMMGADKPVHVQSIPTKLSDSDIIRLADAVAERIGGVIATQPQTAAPAPVAAPERPVRRPNIDRGEDARAEIINHVIRTSLPITEQFGDIEEVPGEVIPDVEEMVQRIQNMGGVPPDGPKPKGQ